MKFSILTGILLTAAIALTLALATAGEVSFFVINGVIQLVIVGSIAIPFVCEKDTQPFWAAYATTAAFVLIQQGYKSEPFQLFLVYAIYFLVGDVSELSASNSIRGFIGLALSTWSPVWLGAIVGGCFATIHHMASPKTTD